MHRPGQRPPFATTPFVRRAAALACLLLGCSSDPDRATTGGNGSSTQGSGVETAASSITASANTSNASGSGATGSGTESGGASTAGATTTGNAATTGAGGATSGGGDAGGSGGVVGVGGAGGTSSTETASSSAGGATSGESTASTGGSGGTSAGFQPCPTDGSPCKIMPFGDSITDGYGVAGGYRVELFRLAVAADKNITFVGSGQNGPSDVDGVPFPPNHEGHSGYTIEPETGRSGVSPLVSSVMPQYTPHIVLLMIGTNDAIDDIDMANAPTRLGALIDSIYDELPDILMVVARPIPSRDDALNTRLVTYGEAIPAVVQARADAGRHIAVVDMYPIISEQADYKNTLLQDTWHPNAAGHALLGAEWFRVLEAWW